MDNIYFQLFISFFKIGLFAFGGGYAILSLIQHEIEYHGWISTQEFTDIIAISQTTPGPIGINSATYVGYMTTGNIMGAAIATLAMVLPSFFIMLTICRFISTIQGNKLLESILSGISPVIIGLIGGATLALINQTNFIDYKSYFIFLIAFVLSIYKRINPIIIIVASGIIGWILY